MRIEIDKRFWFAFKRIVIRFFTVQETGSINNMKEHFISRFGLLWITKK